MKFRWVPWYSKTFEVEETRVEFLQRVREAIHHDDWKEANSRYLGYVYNNKFEIFFKKGPIGRRNDWLNSKEYDGDYGVVLFGDIVTKEEGCIKIELNIMLNWFAYLFIIPLMGLPIVGYYYTGEFLLFIATLVVYILTILFYNLRAHLLYMFFLKIYHNKLDLY